MGKLSVLALSFLLAGCARSSIVPFAGKDGLPAKRYAPTDPATVGIYLADNPFPAFEELGMIHFRSRSFSLPYLYAQIRKDAAAYGAEAVIDIQLGGETHMEFEPQNVCEPVTECAATGCSTEQVCRTEPFYEPVSTYSITGSMIRKKP